MRVGLRTLHGRDGHVTTKALNECGARTAVWFSGGENEWWLADLAAELSMPIATLHRWQRVGWVTSRKVTAAGGRWAIHADAQERDRLCRLRDCPRGWPQPYPTELITPTTKTGQITTTPAPQECIP